MSLEVATKRVDAMLEKVPQWRDLPEVHAALGKLYGDFGPKAFPRARTAYLRAIAAEDKAGKVPVVAIEQLANLEARNGEKMGGMEGIKLIDAAIQRLTGLLEP